MMRARYLLRFWRPWPYVWVYRWGYLTARRDLWWRRFQIVKLYRILKYRDADAGVVFRFTGFKLRHRCRWWHKALRLRCPIDVPITKQVLYSGNLEVK